MKRGYYNMEQTDRELVEQAAQLNTREEYVTWEQRFRIAGRTESC